MPQDYDTQNIRQYLISRYKIDILPSPSSSSSSSNLTSHTTPAKSHGIRPPRTTHVNTLGAIVAVLAPMDCEMYANMNGGQRDCGLDSLCFKRV